jgi:hypothetical protein
MITQQLARLEQMDLKEVWSHEATAFTPWLARDENIALLGEALGLDLEVEAQEKAVGPFRADILCKDIQTNSWVLIENQLERTDHSHLGQVLTYASGLGAVTIVWIAARFTEEHRSTLDWLNKITDSSFRFFGIEVELWRIGSSPAAPKFNIVSKPNNWSQSVATAARALDQAELSETRIMQRDYWAGLNVWLNTEDGLVSARIIAELDAVPLANARPFISTRRRFAYFGVQKFGLARSPFSSLTRIGKHFAAHIEACVTTKRAYQSQFSSITDRAHYGQARIKMRLIGDHDPEERDLPPKPKWMRWTTYNRYLERYDGYGDILENGCIALVAKWMGRNSRLKSTKEFKIDNRFRFPRQTSFLPPHNNPAPA